MHGQSFILGLATLSISTLLAPPLQCQGEEATESVRILMSSTTLSGYVSTVAIWRSAYTTSSVPMFRWNPDSGGNGHYYGVIKQPLDWAQSESVSQALGGHLASVNSAAEQLFLESLYFSGESPYQSIPLWIGLTVEAGTGSVSWSSSEAVTYANWAVNLPSSGSAPLYTAMNWSRALAASNSGGEWSNVPLAGTSGLGGNTTGPYYGMIELTAIVPEPGSLTLMVLGLLAAGCRLLVRKLQD